MHDIRPKSFSLLLLALSVGSMAFAKTTTADWQAETDGRDKTTIVLYTFEDRAYANTTPNETAKNGLPQAVYARDGVETGVKGKFGKGFAVKAPDEGMDLARYGYVQLTKKDVEDSLAGDLTAEVWYQPLSATPGGDKGYSYLMDCQYSSKTGFSLILVGGDQALRASVGNGHNNLIAVSGPLTWEPGQWYHLALSYDSDEGLLTVYRNGEEVASMDMESFGPIAPYSGNLRVGNRLGSNYGPTPGVYDHFRLSSVAYNFESK